MCVFLKSCVIKPLTDGAIRMTIFFFWFFNMFLSNLKNTQTLLLLFTTRFSTYNNISLLLSFIRGSKPAFFLGLVLLISFVHVAFFILLRGLFRPNVVVFSSSFFSPSTSVFSSVFLSFLSFSLFPFHVLLLFFASLGFQLLFLRAQFVLRFHFLDGFFHVFDGIKLDLRDAPSSTLTNSRSSLGPKFFF